MSPRRNVAAMAGVPYSKGSGHYNALGQPNVYSPLSFMFRPPACFGSSSAGNDGGCERAEARAGKGWGNKGKEELPGRRFLVRTHYSP